MDVRAKQRLLTLGVSSALLLLGWRGFAEDQAKKVAAQIADYTLPSGYSEQMGLDMFIEKMVVIAPTKQSGLTITLLQMPATTSRQQMEQQMRQSMQNQFGQLPGAMKNAGEHPVTIKGEKVTLTLGESSSTSYTLRQATGFFVGKGGLVMLMLMGEVENWNWTLVENFCASIR